VSIGNSPKAARFNLELINIVSLSGGAVYEQLPDSCPTSHTYHYFVSH